MTPSPLAIEAARLLVGLHALDLAGVPIERFAAALLTPPVQAAIRTALDERGKIVWQQAHHHPLPCQRPAIPQGEMDYLCDGCPIDIEARSAGRCSGITDPRCPHHPQQCDDCEIPAPCEMLDAAPGVVAPPQSADEPCPVFPSYGCSDPFGHPETCQGVGLCRWAVPLDPSVVIATRARERGQAMKKNPGWAAISMSQTTLELRRERQMAEALAVSRELGVSGLVDPEGEGRR